MDSIPSIINIYTDGSYNPNKNLGAWASILIVDQEINILSNVVSDSTHNRMELLAVIEALNFILSESIRFEIINVYSDSQYVVNLTERRSLLKTRNYLTNKGTPIRNVDLIKSLLNILDFCPIKLHKVKAHQKRGDSINYNRQVDKLVRKLCREAI